MKHFSNEIPKRYEAPAVEILEVEVEKGFAATNKTPTSPNEPAPEPGKSGGPWSGGAWD